MAENWILTIVAGVFFTEQYDIICGSPVQVADEITYSEFGAESSDFFGGRAETYEPLLPSPEDSSDWCPADPRDLLRCRLSCSVRFVETTRYSQWVMKVPPPLLETLGRTYSESETLCYRSSICLLSSGHYMKPQDLKWYGSCLGSNVDKVEDAVLWRTGVIAYYVRMERAVCRGR